MNKFVTYIFGLLLLTLSISGCSTSKNTAGSRFYYASVTRFNTYHNGKESFIKGYLAQEKAVSDNYLEILTLFPVSDANVRKVGAEHFDKAIEKSKKCVKLYSIKAKPKRKSGKLLTGRDSQVQRKNEYNPFLWRAWMLMGDAQTHKGEFLEAAGTYIYILRLYADDPEIVAEARIKTAQCYSELGWNYEAEELFSRALSDSIPVKLKGEYAIRKASHLLKLKNYNEAIPYLVTALSREGVSKTQRVRERFLLGQLYKETGDNYNAYKSFQKVIRMNPPYYIDFNARIKLTETMTGKGGASQFKRLERLSRDPNNKNYLDQIYWAVGNLHLAAKDTLKALKNYETGTLKATLNGQEKGILLLRMSELYWAKADYSGAQSCYSKAIGLIGRDHPSYSEVKLRSEVLDNLIVHTGNIELQDSLIKLAGLSGPEREEIIDNLIHQLSKEEKEAEISARKLQRDQETASIMTQTVTSPNDGAWYFYNPVLVQEGKNAFRNIWGARKLEDNWRRLNKTALHIQEEETKTDSTIISNAYGVDTLSESLNAESDSLFQLSADPHNREYYLSQIPSTAEQIKESENILTDALLNAGIIYKDRLEEYELAEQAFIRLTNEFPESQETDQALYNMYLMYSLWGRNEKALACKERLVTQYPSSSLAKILNDPEFMENARFGKFREDSLYAKTYNAYLDNDTVLIRENCQISAEKYPLGQHRAKFLFLESTLLLNRGDTKGFYDRLMEITELFPENEISVLASQIAKGISEGRIMMSTTFGSIWERRNNPLIGSETLDNLAPWFIAERNEPFVFILAFQDGAVDENQLLFEIARYNFSNFMIRNFDLEIVKHKDIGMLQVKEFLNLDEANSYQRRLFGDIDMAKRLEGLKVVLISEQNLKILLKHYSFYDYQIFFDENFVNIPNLEAEDIIFDEEVIR